MLKYLVKMVANIYNFKFVTGMQERTKFLFAQLQDKIQWEQALSLSAPI